MNIVLLKKYKDEDKIYSIESDCNEDDINKLKHIHNITMEIISDELYNILKSIPERYWYPAKCEGYADKQSR